MHAEELILGVDGGGTKTIAWLATVQEPGTTVGSGTAGPSNPGAVGKSLAIATLDAAIETAFAQAGLAPARVAAACLAVSGAERSAHREAFLQWAADRTLASHVELTNDAEAVLAAGSPDGWGVALIAGTGSFALGRDLQGLTARVGGWGYLFGDEGSGHALGTAGLRAAAQSADGRGQPTSLLATLLSRFDLRQPRDLITAFYSGLNDPRESLAALAPLVTSAAEEGDSVAIQLARTAAADLAQLVIATCNQLNLPPRKYPLALAGGLLCHSPLIRDLLHEELAGQDHLTSSMTLVEDPVAGAVILARQAALAAPTARQP